MSSGFFRLKIKNEESTYDTKIMEYPDIDGYFEAFEKATLNRGTFSMKLFSKAYICIPVENIEYLFYIPEEFIKEENNE